MPSGAPASVPAHGRAAGGSQQERAPAPVRRRALIARQCATFSKRGTCPGEASGACKLLHDRARVAICPRWLRGSCTATADTCLLSHDPSPERMPDCAFFLAGACAAGDDCLYRHVNVGAAAAPCAAFRAAGWCEKGNACEFSHSGEGGLLWGGGINNNVAGERRGTAGGIAGATLRRKRKLTLRRATAGQEEGGGAAKEAAVPSFALQILGESSQKEEDEGDYDDYASSGSEQPG